MAALDPRVNGSACRYPCRSGSAAFPFTNEPKSDGRAKRGRGRACPTKREHRRQNWRVFAYAHTTRQDAALHVLEAAKDVKVPMLISDAEKRKLMDIRENGGRVAEILKITRDGSGSTSDRRHGTTTGYISSKLQAAWIWNLSGSNTHLKKTPK